MPPTYDPNLATSRDYVRFLIGDTDVPDNAELTDEEIDAMLVLYPNPHCAAYRLLDSLMARSHGPGGRSGPIASKSVDGLSISYATASKGQTRADLRSSLRAECAKQSQGGGILKVFGGYGPRS